MIDTDIKMSEYMDKLIHVGFTNKYQLNYANEAEGAFYCDSDNECNIPLYMLSAHSMRALDSVVVETHDALVEQNKALHSALCDVLVEYRGLGGCKVLIEQCEKALEQAK